MSGSRQTPPAGRLALDDRLSDFVPDIPNGPTITVRDLLAMRGGVYDFTDDTAWFDRYETDPTLPGWTAQDVLAIVRAHAAEARPPDTQTVYWHPGHLAGVTPLSSAAAGGHRGPST